jgi:hypothetical protein
MWGIGRYLYEIEGVWVDVEQRGKGTYIKSNQQGKLKAAYDTAVKKIFGAVASQQTAGGNAAGASATRSQPAKNQPSQQPPAPAAQQNQNNSQPPTAPQNTSTEPPVPQAPVSGQNPKGDVIPMHYFKIHSMKPAGKESQLLELCNSDGEITSAYVRSSEQGIAVGTHLRNVRLEEKTNSYGKYNLISSYEVAA